jgi:hypothetical protein
LEKSSVVAETVWTATAGALRYLASRSMIGMASSRAMAKTFSAFTISTLLSPEHTAPEGSG